MMQVTWLYILPSVVMVLFLAGALVFAIMQRGVPGSAKTLAILGLSIMLLLRIATFVVNYVIAQLASSNFMLYHGVYSLVSTLLYMLALSLLIAAIFSRRGNWIADDGIADQRYPVASDNPYASPAN